MFSAPTSFGSLKRSSHPSTDSRPPLKRSKTEQREVGHSRKKMLNDLRAICDRWAVHVKLDDSTTQVVDGKELLRVFLLETLLPPKGKKFPMRECKCRHAGGLLPEGKDMCMTAGTVDAGKANAFVMSDLKQTLRSWLSSKKRHSVEVTDVDDSDEEGSEEDADEESQPFPKSSYTESAYPSSPLKPGDVGYKRKSTKQRLAVLHYLTSHSDDRVSFNRAFKQLCEPELHLVHLCGCGLSIDGLKGACVTGSHLKLASAELNREHVHYHFVLQKAPSKDAYLKIWDSIQGSEGGRFDDVF
jgi:hypothetical protein